MAKIRRLAKRSAARLKARSARASRRVISRASVRGILDAALGRLPRKQARVNPGWIRAKAVRVRRRAGKLVLDILR